MGFGGPAPAAQASQQAPTASTVMESNVGIWKRGMARNGFMNNIKSKMPGVPKPGATMMPGTTGNNNQPLKTALGQ